VCYRKHSFNLVIAHHFASYLVMPMFELTFPDPIGVSLTQQ